MENKPSPATTIESLEKTSEEGEKILQEMQEILARWKNHLPEHQKLIHYYRSGQWRTDYESDTNGFYGDMKRGILSEDFIYNLDLDLHFTAIKMIKLGAEFLDEE